jgi:hypothetical protein
MGYLLARDLSVAARRVPLAVVVTLHAAALALFVLLWGGGVPLLPGGNFSEQQHLVQTAILAGLLPWAAARCIPGERGNALVYLSGLTSIPPSRILLAQFGSRAAVLSLIVLAGFPLMIVGQQIAAVPFARAAAGVAPSLGLAVAASGAATWSSLVCADRVGAWILATLLTIGLVTAVGSLTTPAATAALCACGVAAAAGSALRADGSQRYFSEQAA